MANKYYHNVNASQFQYDAMNARFGKAFADITIEIQTGTKFKYSYMYLGAKVTVIEKGDFVYAGSTDAMVSFKSRTINIEQGALTSTIEDSRVGTKILVSDFDNIKWKVDFAGSTFSDTENSGNKGDFISLSNSANTYYGRDGGDMIYGLGGSDNLYGGLGDDELHGGKNSDDLYGGQGNDNLYGESGVDYMYGGTGNDGIRGEKGSDRLFGEDGNDKLWGNQGKDGFYFARDNDKDIIRDFQDNKDTIYLYINGLWTNSKSAKQVLNQFGSQDGTDFVLNFGLGDILTIENTTKSQLLDDITIL
jgi:Ca2+-binding RTX toxin-like protein